MFNQCDHYDLITSIGVISGIGYYMVTKDSWLLVTFLGILYGRVLEQANFRRNPVQKIPGLHPFGGKTEKKEEGN